MAASPPQLERWRRHEAMKGMRAFEVRIGDTFDWVDDPPSQESRKAGRPVARIVDLIDSQRIGEGFATGFVVSPGLLVTNWHVFATPDHTRASGAHFSFEKDERGIIQPGVVFEIDPRVFFFSDKDHDIAIVGLSKRAAVGTGELADFGSVTLIPTLGKILVGHSVNIIQHPDGRHKHWALQNNRLSVEPDEDDLFMMYTADTLEGSSGSPAFNKDWELVAVHHGGVPHIENDNIMTLRGEVWRKGMPETDIKWAGNEGARLSKLYALLKNTRLPNPAHHALLAELLVEPKAVASAESTPRTNEAITIENKAREDGLMNITVNGTANFYLGTAGGGPISKPIVDVGPAPREITGEPAPGAEKKLKFDPNYNARQGYISTFLTGYDVPRPLAPRDELYEGPGGRLVLKYHHYSLVMHRDRRLAMWTAANVDYTETKRRFTREQLGTDTWKPDPRIPIEAQIEDVEFYEPAGKFDRGHLFRRDDGAWGETEIEEEFANSDTFHWTNCTPQHEHFNRHMYQYKGIWGGLENHIASQARFVGRKLILFSGPILSEDDESRDFGSGIEVQVPSAFWKIVIVAEDVGGNRRLRAYGFILDQTSAIKKYGWEGKFRAEVFSEQQVSLATITERSRVEFDPKLHEADPLAGDPTESRGRRLTTLESVRLD
ncbi:MAG TPA: DNA/RNA non-specific endonuclease [Pyrinomonadaceae bacterium]|nr:DNA/RNA non-specific endonuclease [Pyrinomonadaceae bacterium]